MKRKTMKRKTNDLLGTQLDWAVAQALCLKATISKACLVFVDGCIFMPSVYWEHAGPIIECEFIHIHGSVLSNGDTHWHSLKVHETKTGCHMGYGPSPLTAAMRCFVTSKLGYEIEIPEVLK